MTTSETLMGQLKNAPRSAMNLAENLTYPFRHPLEFNKDVTNLGKGVYQKFTEGVQPQEKLVDDVWEGAKDRFGGWDNIKRTAYEDPFGIAADATGLATLRPLIKAAPKLKQVGQSVSDAIDRKLYSDEYPVESYRQVAKTSFSTKTLKDSINTALEERLAPSLEGIGRRQAIVDTIDEKVMRLIDESTEGGNAVDIDTVFRQIGDLKSDLGTAMNPDGLGNLVKIDKVVEKIKATAEAEGRTKYTIADLQQLKRKLYSSSKYDVNKPLSDPAINQAQKNIARTAKETIEDYVPEVKDLNSRQGRLIELDADLEKATRRIAGRDKFNIGDALRMGRANLMVAPLHAVSPVVGGVAQGLATGHSLWATARAKPLALANRSIRVHHAKKGNLRRELDKMDIWSEMDRLNIPKELFFQGLLQSGELED